MCEKMGNIALLKISGELVDVISQVHDIAEHAFGNVESHHMQLATVIRQVGCHLGTDECFGQVCDLESTVY
jgi:hypothetical protein